MRRENRRMASQKLPQALRQQQKVDNAQNIAINTLERKIKKLENAPELKFIDTQVGTVFASDASTGAGNILLLNGVAQGVTRITRLGDLARMTSVQIKIQASLATDELAPQSQRLILVYDKQADGAALTVANVIDGAVIGGITHRPYQLDNVPNRFKILYDKTFAINPQAVGTVTVATGVTAAYAPNTKIIHKKIKLNKKVNYGLGTAGTVADISTGSLYLLFLGTDATAGQPATALGGVRVYFKDP